MKKILLAVVLVCVLCAASVAALADSWDFLHSVIRVATPEDIGKLAAEQGFELSGMGDEGSYDILDFSLEGIPCYAAILFNYDAESTYMCVLSFHASEESTPEQPGEAFETLSTALFSRYGEPDFNETSSESISLSWCFADAFVCFTWSAGFPPDLMFIINGANMMGDAKFPFAPTGIAAAPPAAAVSGEPFSFRNGIAGGMTVEEAVAAEGRTPDAREAGSLRYNGEIVAGLPADLTYHFQDGKLAAAFYQFETKDALALSNFADFETISVGLASKYGDAAADEADWRNDLFQDNPSAHGMAVAIGHLVRRSSWNARDAVIDHTLSGEENQIRHTLAYTFAVPPADVPDTTGL